MLHVSLVRSQEQPITENASFSCPATNEARNTESFYFRTILYMWSPTHKNDKVSSSQSDSLTLLAEKSDSHHPLSSLNLGPTEQLLNHLVLAPLDGVQVDSFLNQLPQWAQLSQEAHALSYRLEDVVDLHLCREPPNAKPDAGVRVFVAVAQCSQDVARFQRG